MSRTRAIALILGIVFLQGAMAEQDKAGGLDTDIFFVTTDGLWTAGDKHGRFRLVVNNTGWEHTRSFIYLQWILLDQDREESFVVDSVPVEELNSGDWRHFSAASFMNGRYLISYRNRGRESPRRALLTPAGPGEYSILIDDDEPLE